MDGPNHKHSGGRQFKAKKKMKKEKTQAREETGESITRVEV